MISRLWDEGVPGRVRFWFACLLLAASALACKAPAFTPELKAQVLRDLGRQIETEAYADKADFKGWPQVAAKHQGALEAAMTPEAFAEAANTALGELKVSHLRLFTPEQYEAYLANETLAALGFDALRHEDTWLVMRVEPGSPADMGGLRGGDILQGLPTDQPLTKALGPREVGRKVTLTWLRDHVPMSQVFTMTRVRKWEPIALRWLDDEVAVLRVPSFAHGRYDVERVQALLQEARKATGIILDLRGNTGGRVDHVAHLLSHFLPAGTPLFRVVDRDTADGAPSSDPTRGHLRSAEPPIEGPYTGALVVLVLPSNASGGELFPAALQEHGRAQVMGLNTPGAVLGSRVFPLVHGWAAQLPFLDMLTPRGRPLEGVGITPDLPLNPQTLARDETALAAARKALRPPKAA